MDQNAGGPRRASSPVDGAPRRDTRYQGAIVREHSILLIQHCELATDRRYWLLPGGRIETGETEEECVAREMQEETHLRVGVERLLVACKTAVDAFYPWRKTYLCHIIEGEAAPGEEPEPEHYTLYSISDVRWLDLRDDPSTWDTLIVSDDITYPELLEIRRLLRY